MAGIPMGFGPIYSGPGVIQSQDMPPTPAFGTPGGATPPAHPAPPPVAPTTPQQPKPFTGAPTTQMLGNIQGPTTGAQNVQNTNAAMNALPAWLQLNPNSGITEGNNAKQRYLDETVNPGLARQITQEGANGMLNSTFAAARYAQSQAEGNRLAESVYEDARNAQQARDLANLAGYVNFSKTMNPTVDPNNYNSLMGSLYNSGLQYNLGEQSNNINQAKNYNDYMLGLGQLSNTAQSNANQYALDLGKLGLSYDQFGYQQGMNNQAALSQLLLGGLGTFGY